MPCSSVTKAQRRRATWRKSYNGVCAHCGRAVGSANQTIDHFIPISMGGTNDQRNLMPLCVDCNLARQSDAIDPAEYYQYAQTWAIRQCCAYKKQFMAAHRSADGWLNFREKRR